MSTALQIFKRAFAAGRTARSQQYREGVMAALMRRLHDGPQVACAFKPGTSDFDAFFAGVDEGYELARLELARTANQPTKPTKRAS